MARQLGNLALDSPILLAVHSSLFVHFSTTNITMTGKSKKIKHSAQHLICLVSKRTSSFVLHLRPQGRLRTK